MAKSTKARAKRPARKSRTKARGKAAASPAAQTVTSYLIARGTARAIDFYKAAFGARPLFQLTGPDGRIGHAELRIGTSRIMLADEHPEVGAVSPESTGGSPVTFHLAVKNADAAVAKALKAGATLKRPVEDQFYGQRSGMVADPFGYSWFLSATIEKVTPRRMQRRWNAMTKAA